ncbi:YdeI/OmpD-associated family protein [Kordiimonas sp.]|uniref:YdeI/OmpD-associated family protein n=1 Tax=Kordiimonas sp. TaxID=1970157 RepID=UPI003A93C5F8
MSTIHVEAQLYSIGEHTLLHLPKEASAALPSRGVTMVEGTLNGAPIKTVLEPDGKKSHWLNVDAHMLKAAGAAVGDMVTLELESSKDWIEPTLPADLKAALEDTPDAYATWLDTTPMARWDWVRWMRATKSEATRAKRIANACDMLSGGKRRVCCFDRAQCTEPAVSKSGVLLDL